MAGPAELDTRDRPSEALEAAVDAASPARDAPADAACDACEVVELYRAVVRRCWRGHRERRSAARDVVESITEGYQKLKRVKIVRSKEDRLSMR